MNPKNRAELQARVEAAAAVSLERPGYVSPIDVVRGIGWLDEAALQRWRQLQIPHLEAGIQANLARVSEAMRLFRAWATRRRLDPRETAYVARTSARPRLRFSKSGNPTIERLYRTHWVSPELGAKKRARVSPASADAGP